MKEKLLVLLMFLAGCVLAELPSDVRRDVDTTPMERVVESGDATSNSPVTLASLR